ncbi:MAG: hypothetical protein AAFY71_02465 [Bacteroidota bacterium]
MNRLIQLIAFFAICFFFSCSTEGVNPSTCREGDCTYTVKEHADLIIENQDDLYWFRLEEGENLVFRYNYEADDSPQIADDEYTEIILWEIPADQESFDVSDADLEQVNMFVAPICNCTPGWKPVNIGHLEGEKINRNTWRVSFTISFEWAGMLQERKVEARFEME